MPRLLVERIHTLVTMAGDEEPLAGVDLLIEDGRVAAIGRDLAVERDDDLEVLDGTDRVVYPGFVNTHHHLYQALTRNLPGLQDCGLFAWLRGLYQIWRELGPEAVEIGTRVGIAELLLSGCTTTTDHFYVFPAAASPELLDVEIEAAREMGIRFHPTRGSMSRGVSQGGLPPDDLVQAEAEILADCERVIDRYHEPEPHSLCRVALAPCSPFSVTGELLEETAALARERGVLLHTHLAETRDEEDYCLEVYGMRPLAYLERSGWVGRDVWFAHGIHFDDDEIGVLAGTGTSIAHCPASNLRLGSGICRVPDLLAAGVNVGLAVDGSASNDASSMVREMQLALLVHRVGTGVEAMPARRVLEMATRGGARLLGRPEIGRLEPGSAGDLAIFRLDRVDFAGAMHDPASALLFCGSGQRADASVVAGRVLVRGGELLGIDEERLFHRANAVSRRMVGRVERGSGGRA